VRRRGRAHSPDADDVHRGPLERAVLHTPGIPHPRRGRTHRGAAGDQARGGPARPGPVAPRMYAPGACPVSPVRPSAQLRPCPSTSVSRSHVRGSSGRGGADGVTGQRNPARAGLVRESSRIRLVVLGSRALGRAPWPAHGLLVAPARRAR
jgi:hypothetical protein